MSSPYDLLQDLHDAPMPTARYLEFARLSGCGGASAVFECLVKADIRLVAAASNNVTNSREFGGLWGFPPVTDGVLIKDHPSITLAKKRVNGEKIFVGVRSSIFPSLAPIQESDNPYSTRPSRILPSPSQASIQKTVSLALSSKLSRS